MSAVLKKISTPQQIEDLRAEIDSVDKELIALLEKRASLVFAIGDYKKKYNMPIHDPVRELKIRSKIKNLVTPEGPLKTCEMESLVMTIVERFRFFLKVFT